MNHTLSVQASVEIDAPPARVWAVLTTPALIKEYLFGAETVTDWQPGHEIVFQGSFNGHAYRDHGVIKEFEPLRKLSYTYWSGFSGLADAPKNYGLVTYTLQAVGTKTVFTWEQRGFPDEARQQHSQAGMTPFLAQIKAIAERRD